MDYPNATYLIYATFKSGSLMIDCAVTEEEVKEKVEMYTKRYDEYELTYSLSTKFKVVYIPKKDYWWK